MQQPIIKRPVRTLARTCTLALIVLLWVVYLFERWAGQYALYPVIGYTGYEVLTFAAGLSRCLLLAWLLAVLVQIVRRKAPKADLCFAALLLAMLAGMSVYSAWVSSFRQVVTPATLVSLSNAPYQAHFRMPDGQELTLSCPDVLAHAMGRESKEYLITYTSPLDDPLSGALIGASCLVQ